MQRLYHARTKHCGSIAATVVAEQKQRKDDDPKAVVVAVEQIAEAIHGVALLP